MPEATGAGPPAQDADVAGEVPVHILLVEVGRRADDGLPEGATGAALLCYCAAPSERQAVDETVRVLREAGLAPLEVEAHGTRDAPEGIATGPDERLLMDRALAENAVVVASLTTFGS